MINELTRTRGKYIFDIKFDSGSEFRVAGNRIEEALDEIKEYCEENNDHNGEEYGPCDYMVIMKVRTDEYDPREGE